MRITFIGATHEVTGSCFYVEAAGSRFLVDCGMEQGPDAFANEPLPLSEADIDFVLLTHAHIDHSGKLPWLYARGFRGPVYATRATADLCDIMLRDSAHIQMFEAEWRNRKGKRAGQAEFVPLYTMADALGLIGNLEGCPYNEILSVAEGIKIRFNDAGHLLGSASIEVWLKEEDTEKKMIFSGDIGNVNQPILKDPTYPVEADYVVMESTYGDRSHGAVTDYVTELAKVIQETFDKGGNVVIPSFAVGRTQEMLYFLRQIKQDGLVTGHGNFPVYVDSPLAVEATNIFGKHYQDCFDEEATALLNAGINPIRIPGLKLSITSDESRAINVNETPKVILSASGMCDAGRIKHHLKHNLWRSESTILFVGYQAVGTLGRALVEGARDVRLFGEDVTVNASIKLLPGVSGHADNNGLMKWAASLQKKPGKVFVVHGDDTSCKIFTQRLCEELGYDATAPYSGSVYDLKENLYIEETTGIRLEKAKKRKASAVYERLLAAGQRLLAVIRRNEGGANKDLARFADQINSLCDKWDR